VRVRPKKKGAPLANAIGESAAGPYIQPMNNGYRIYILDSQHRISLAFDFKGPTDESAVAAALQYTNDNSVEVWKGGCLVAQLARVAS